MANTAVRTVGSFLGRPGLMLMPLKSHRVSAALSFICLSVLCSCSSDSSTEAVPATYTVRDSAGVEIVESSGPAWVEGEAWTLTEEPLLSIGMVDGPEEYMLYRSVSAIELDDGRIVFGNGGSQDLRFYDSEGTFLHASGGDGDGPGEFRSVGFIWRLGPDSLAVLDFSLLRISILDTNGNFGRSFRLTGSDRELVFPNGIFADGSVLASATLRDDGSRSEAGAFRDLLDHQHFDTEGQFLAKVTTVPGPELYSAAGSDGSGVTTSPRHGLTPWTVTGSDTWFYGSSEAYEVQEWSKDGLLLKVFRLDKERRPTPPEDIAAWEERLRELDSSRRAFWENVPVSSHLPAYERVILDRAGNLWLAEYSVLEEPPVWLVLSPEGHWLGSVAVPPGGRISEIGEDYVLGTWRDEMDVETVRMYGLVKPGRG